MKNIFALLIVSSVVLNSCCDEDFIIPNDLFANAMDVTSRIAVGVGCTTPSQDPNFTTVGATPDGSAGECWFNTGPVQNVWFKFKAPASLNGTIVIYVGPTYGTQRRTNLTVWDPSAVTPEIGCSTYQYNGADDAIVSVYYSGVTAGQYYYFSVDVQDAPSAGTFSLCMYDSD